MRRFDGRCAVVTGAARGIGLGIAQRLAQEGSKLFLVDRLAPELDAVIAELAGQTDVAGLALDLTDADAVDRIADGAIAAFGAIDVLVNNAGMAISGSIEDFSDEQWTRVIAVNITAPFRLSRRIVPLMAARGYGRVVNISSMNARIGMRTDAGYSVTKAGIEALTRSIAVDYGPFGVTANTVAPGTIETPLNTAILQAWGDDSPLKQIVVLNKPIPGNGEVADIAAAVAYLVSEEAKYVSGQVLGVDGGLVGTRFVPDAPGSTAARFTPD